MTQLIYTANTCNFHFHLTLRKSVTNGRTANSTMYRVAAQLIKDCLNLFVRLEYGSEVAALTKNNLVGFFMLRNPCTDLYCLKLDHLSSSKRL